MAEERVICRAEFNPKVRTYWLISGIVILTVTIVGIPLLLLWIPIGLAVTGRHLRAMECVLTERALKVKKGVLIRVEKTIPLEKITDMGMVQGPIMRTMDLHTLTVETAGQSGAGALVALTGIVDAPAFREQVLQQRDRGQSSSGSSPSSGESSSSPVAGSETLLTEIRDALLRIESKLDSKSDGPA